MEIVIILILAILFFREFFDVETAAGCTGCLFLCLIFAILLGGCILIWENIGK